MTNGPALEDRVAVEDLYNRYMWALDTADTDAYADCFHDDATVVENVPGNRREANGRAQIHEFVANRFHANPDFAGHQHRWTNMVFDPDGDGRDDAWRVRAYIFATHYDGETAKLTWCGHYDDVVTKRDGAWRFERRTIAPWAGDVVARFPEK
jgi:uncharacterized protein (TIGR02246 family)